MEIIAARVALAKRIHDDIGWWYEQAKAYVESPRGKIDDNGAKIVLAVLDKLLPTLREVVKDEGHAKPPVAIAIHGISRIPRPDSSASTQTLTVEQDNQAIEVTVGGD